MSEEIQNRRRFMRRAAQVSTVAIAAPYVHTSRAAGSLSIGYWDHWVPNANQARLIRQHQFQKQPSTSQSGALSQ